MSSRGILLTQQTILQLFDQSSNDPLRARQLQADLHHIQTTTEAWGLISGLSRHYVGLSPSKLMPGPKCTLLFCPHGPGQNLSRLVSFGVQQVLTLQGLVTHRATSGTLNSAPADPIPLTEPTRKRLGHPETLRISELTCQCVC